MTDYSDLTLVRGMSYLAETQAAIAHNLANVDSTGYKRQISVANPVSDGFSSVLNQSLDTVGYTQRTDWTDGALRSTGDKLHVALEGPGFLMVEDDAGQRFFTRNGTMLVDPGGRLIDPSGHFFLDSSGQKINLGNPSEVDRTALLITRNGTIGDGSQVIAQLGVYALRDTTQLQPAGSSKYFDVSGQRPSLAPTTTVRQGSLERSNVDSLTEMVQMISVQRGYQATAKALTSLGRIKTAFVASANR